jgi:predicted N-acyltransferase
MITLRAELVSRIQDLSASAWDSIIGQRYLFSTRWYEFIESALFGYRPCFVLVYAGNRDLVAALGCRRHYYYVPTRSRLLKRLARGLLRVLPLLSCETPLAEKSGFSFAPGMARPEIARVLFDGLAEAARQQGAFFTGLDYLDATESALVKQAVPDCWVSPLMPDTFLDIRWSSLDEYVAQLDYRKRKNARRELRQAEEKGYKVERLAEFARYGAEFRALVQNVHRKHGEEELPVKPEVYELAERMLPETRALAVWHGGRIVACELIFRQGDQILPTLVGLDYAHGGMIYALLAYEEIRYAIESGARRIWMGTTGYAFKERLGCAQMPRYYGLRTRLAPLNKLLARL